MKSYIISKNDCNQRVDRFIQKKFPKLPKSLMFKEIRKKNIKVNKKRTEPSYILCNGDLIELYLKDDVLEEKKVHYDFTDASKHLDIIYEDENIILVDKKPGLLCHPDGNEYTDTLIARIKRYLYDKNEWKPKEENCFTPALANRIDRNTGGIVIAAKNAQALRILNEKIKSREIQKLYLCVAQGIMPKETDILTGYLTKNNSKNKVNVSLTKTDGAKKIVTKYTVIDTWNNNSLIEIDLLTGRTHQIRAHLSFIGHPLVNDGKYGKEHGRYRQALYSYKLKFNFNDDNLLSYLYGKEFEIKNCEVYRNFYERKYWFMKKDIFKIISPIHVLISIIFDAASIWVTSISIISIKSGATFYNIVFLIISVFAIILAIFYTKEIFSNGILFYDDRLEFTSLDENNIIKYNEINSIETFKDTKASLKKNLYERRSLLIFNLKDGNIQTIDLGLTSKKTLSKIENKINEKLK